MIFLAEIRRRRGTAVHGVGELYVAKFKPAVAGLGLLETQPGEPDQMMY